MWPAFTSSTSAILAAAGQVRSSLDRRNGRIALSGDILMATIDIVHRTTVADNKAFEAPLLAKPLLQQVAAGAAGRSVHRVVDTHDGVGLAFNTAALNAGRYVFCRSYSLALASKQWRSGSGPLCTA